MAHYPVPPLQGDKTPEGTQKAKVDAQSHHNLSLLEDFGPETSPLYLGIKKNH